MKTLIPRRIRFGRYEWRCCVCERWYWKLASHVRRFHDWPYSATNVFDGKPRP